MIARAIIPSAIRRMCRLSYAVNNDYKSDHYGGWQLIFCTPLFGFAVAMDYYDIVWDGFSSRIDLMVIPQSWSLRIPRHVMLWRKEIVRRSWGFSPYSRY